MKTNTILLGDNIDTLKTLPDNSVNCCVTSPPYYGLRNYDIDGQIGLEETPEQYIENLVCVFREVKRVLKDKGTLWLNIGDSYAGGAGRWGGTKNISGFQLTDIGSLTEIQHSKKWEHSTIPVKSLIGIPWMLVFAMRNDGWILRQDIIWHKPSPMPESVTDRFTKSHEYIFLFAKQPKYYFDHNAALEPATGYDNRKDTMYKGGDKDISCGAHNRWATRGYKEKDDLTRFFPQHHGKDIATFPMRNKRDVWTIASEPSSEKHFAMFPQKLITPCILCGCPEGGVVLDPFMGSGTTAVVAKKLMRNYIGCEIKPDYIKIAERRIAEIDPLFDTVGENECA